MVREECISLRSNQWECSQVETKNISFILVSNNKCLLSHELLPCIFDYLPSAYLIAHNCGMTWRFWFSDSVVPTFVRTVKHIYFLIWNSISSPTNQILNFLYVLDRVWMCKRKRMYWLRMLHLFQRAHSMSTGTHKSSSSQVPTALLTTALIILWLSLQGGDPYSNCLLKDAVIFLCIDWSQ